MNNKIFEPNLWNVENLFKGIYNVPVYQRPYSWGKEEVSVLMNDVYDTYVSVDKNQGYFLGNIMISDKNEKEVSGLISKYDIIDGQQRIITLTLILLSIYSIASFYNIPQSDVTISSIKKALWKYVNREYKKENRSLKLNSIEKDCFINLFDICFYNPERIKDFTARKNNNKFELRVLNNYKFISDFIEKKIVLKDPNNLLDFADYILNYIQVIVIIANCSECTVFSIFESMNSKGKKLEEIDLIKSYIFSKIDINLHSKYLKIWGDLIIETEDKLYEYLQIYIKSYIKFFSQNIKILNFKKICEEELAIFYEVNTESDGITRLLDELYHNVDVFQMLDREDSVFKFLNNKKFKFYYKVFKKFDYKHPNPLFFRVLKELKEHNITQNEVVQIFEATIIFLMKFLAISSRDSKDVITTFKEIIKNIQETGVIKYKYILYSFEKSFVSYGITNKKLKSDLLSADMYKANKELTVTLLAMFEATISTDDKKHISYDEAYNIIDNYGSGKPYSLDHILPRKPKVASKLKYMENKEEGTLILKEGHDFPDDIVSGLDYDIFVSGVLNKIGNLRILFTDQNSSKNNSELEEFRCYMDIENRSHKIVDFIIDNCINLESSKLISKDIDEAKKKKKKNNLIKMRDMIDKGMLSKGDSIYLIDCDNSKAVIIDHQFVRFNGHKMTFNEWGCAVKGWSSICIYKYAAKVGEQETFQDKRENYQRNIEL